MLQLAKPKHRFLYLDSLRAISAIYVVMHHAVLQYYLVEPTNLSKAETFLLKFFSDGHLAVDMFIVLSGFSLMLAVTKNKYQLKGGIALFFKRRIIRIVPPYYASLLVSFLLATLFISQKTGTIWDFSIPITNNDIISHLLFVHDFFLSTSPKISYSLWSISVECRLYLFFPLMVLLWRKKGAWSAFLFSVITTVIFSITLVVLKGYNTDINLLRSGVSPFIILFTLGMVAADISFSYSNIASNIRRIYNNLNATIVVIFFIAAFIIYKMLPSLIMHSSLPAQNKELLTEETKDIIFGIIAALFLFVCAAASKSTKDTWLSGLLNWRPLAFAGTFSYSLYLIHPALLQILSQYILNSASLSIFVKACLLLTLGTPLIMLMSYLFFLVFERPFMISSKKYKSVDSEVITA